jgi:hypothetical protein
MQAYEGVASAMLWNAKSGLLMRVRDTKNGVIQCGLSHEGWGCQDWGNSMRVVDSDTSSQEECL